MLSRRDFNVRAVVSDNHSTNVSAYKHLKALYPCSMRHNAIANPLKPKNDIYLLFDTVHLVKNIRNNLLANKFFQIPALETTLMDLSINITPEPKKIFLSNNIELTSNTASITDEESSILQDFLETVNQENFDHITISQDAVDVITFVSGYISRSLLNSLDCEECKIALTNDPVSSTYLDDYNRGGLEIPTSGLNSYTQCAFSILDHLEQRILEVDVPFKVLAHSILNKLSSE